MGRGGNASFASAGGRKVTPAELKKHADPADAWVAIHGKVYDVSKWNAHPGGRVLYTAAGGDASDAFRAFHSAGAHDMLDKFYVGELVGKADEISAFEKDYRELITQMKAKGMFKASLLYYLWKFASTTAIAVAAVYVTLAATTLSGRLLGAALTALFWQQCGWLAHDFAHHQVFRDRRLNDMMVLIIGNLYQGFSLDWWKNKHNTHHVIPNLHESEVGAHDGDPDIDTLPFLAWSLKLAKKTRTAGAPENSGISHFMMDWQAYLYFPILLFARLTWSWQSAAYAFEAGNAFWGGAAPEKIAQASGAAITLRYPLMEKLLIVCHYAFFGSVAYAAMGSPLAAFGWWLFAECAGGILLAIPFGVGHNGMEVFDVENKPGFAELQVRTTRNVNEMAYDPLGLVGWFTGGLHLQVEHHLFPTMPRHNLAQARKMLEPLCAKHKIPYRATSLWTGTVEVLSHLSDVSMAIKDFPAA